MSSITLYTNTENEYLSQNKTFRNDCGTK